MITKNIDWIIILNAKSKNSIIMKFETLNASIVTGQIITHSNDKIKEIVYN